MKPKSLTATVHIRFHYDDAQVSKPVVSSGEVEMMGKILDQASDMEPEMREVLVKFANYLNELSHGNGQGSPK